MGALSEYFGFEENDTDLTTEVIAGITTFLTMSYIVVVNPAIMTQFPGENGKPGIAIPATPNSWRKSAACRTSSILP